MSTPNKCRAVVKRTKFGEILMTVSVDNGDCVFEAASQWSKLECAQMRFFQAALFHNINALAKCVVDFGTL